MDYELREKLIHDHFISKMSMMYLPPQNCKNNPEAAKMYGKELRRVINTRISSDIDINEVFIGQLNKLWDRCVAVHDFRIWFTPSLIAKQAGKVNAEYVSHQKANDAQWQRLTKPSKGEEVRADKTDAAGSGWTIEKCDAHIAEMERMMEAGEIQRYMGQKLMGIPIKAKERLLNAGQTDTN